MMLELSKDIKIPNSKDHREHQTSYEEVYSLFEDKRADVLKENIKQNKRIPQEIISYAILKNS